MPQVNAINGLTNNIRLNGASHSLMALNQGGLIRDVITGNPNNNRLASQASIATVQGLTSSFFSYFIQTLRSFLDILKSFNTIAFNK